MKQGIFEIKSNVALTATVYKMVLTGDTSAITCPGQFVNILLDGLFLRRPISVNDCVGAELTLIYKVVGKGTEQMAGMAAGQTLDVLTGLGNGYDLSKAGDKPLLIGGGVGVPHYNAFSWYRIEAENFESIHNHSAYACVERTLS